ATGNGVEKDVMKAIELFDKALAHPAVVPEDKIFFLEHKAYVYLELNKLDEVQKIYNLIVSIDATYADAKTRLTAAIKNSVDNNIPETSLKSEKTFAFVIANEDYKRVSPVPFAKNDGNVFAEYCKKTLGVPEKNVYLVENATLGDMKYHVNLIKKIANAFNGEGRVIFYYAGHGIPDESQRTSYLLPVDGYGNDVTSGYPLESLYTELASIPAKSVMVFMDACFSGAQRDGGMLAEARGVTIKPKEEMPMGKLVVFSAAQGDETAYPYTEKKHGMFTYYLLKKLQDTKGDTTLGELMDYVTTEVKQQSILQNKKSQTPKVIPAQSVAGVWQSLTLK
ncbi:MAG: caspase family protein, partial [Prevotella sp.]|nr:caspase family protein [Prevotella sp.]